ncbi:MAG: helix-turn-helix domain-containing protein [Chloroflexi bacterium]|nr:helix-turn-helix domain-containing protein [Chloroflexota bacterium]
MPDTTPITIRELISLGLPAETRVIAGHAQLDRPVTWVVVTPANDSTLRLAAGDFVFLVPPYPDDLAQRLARLADLRVACIAVLGEPTVAMPVAIPVVVLPHSADVRRIERIALSLLIERSAGLEQRAAHLYQRLTVLIAENTGLDAMAALIRETTGKSVLIQDKRLATLAASFAPDLDARREDIATWAGAMSNLPEEWRDRKRAAQNQEVAQQSLALDHLARLVAPIVVMGVARGFLSLIATEDALTQFDHAAAEQSAAACALEMAKAKAVSEAEKRVRGSFIDALLSGSLAPPEAASWARRNRYDPEGLHTVLVADWLKKAHPSHRRLETMVREVTNRHEHGALVQMRENEVVVLARLDARQGVESARRLAANIRRRASAEFPNDPLAMGIGRAAEALIGLRDSYREARQAQTMARRLAEPNALYFGELNVYRLLFQLEDNPELATFADEVLGKLIEYDREQGTDLVQTLAAYFTHKGNLSQTAEALFVHRNTLLYRMERIKEISGLDLDNPETRFNIQLALRAHRLLSAREE